ncbi:hypothetical protein Pan153_52170 [Gimesia panareensis]|uniref:Uncharacterized protein n=1 Tax=Gimesia panareensis TaxID=2527978 RepID=A0A518FW32_9PLAN|nr:hypothetical protein [Gimesia panareensis]QDV20542.1 hypothetical protein Pan153_52170 [Gimesia panareensis]
MPSKQVKDILEHIRSVHHQLNQVVCTLGAQEPDPRLQLLLRYLGRHEENFSKALKRYEKDAVGKGVLETWLQFSSDEIIDEAFQEVDLHMGMPPEEIIRNVLLLDTKLVKLYRDLAVSAPVPRVQELFVDLIQMEEGKEHQYARILQEWESG